MELMELEIVDILLQFIPLLELFCIQHVIKQQ